MHPHPNARLTPLSRDRLLRRYIVENQRRAALAAHAGISLRTAYKWLPRYRSGGATALLDLRSDDPLQLQQAVAAPAAMHAMQSR